MGLIHKLEKNNVKILVETYLGEEIVYDETIPNEKHPISYLLQRLREEIPNGARRVSLRYANGITIGSELWVLPI